MGTPNREFALLLLALTAIPLFANTVTGSSGPDFSLTVDPSNVSGYGYVQVGVILSSLNNFSGNVTLQVSAPYLVYSLSQNPVMLRANASLTVTLTLANYQGYGVTGADGIQASSGSIGHLVFVSVSIYGTAPDFMLANSPTTMYIVPGHNISDTIIISSINNFNGIVTLNATLPFQYRNASRVSLNPTTLEVQTSPSSATQLTLIASSSAPLGLYTIIVTATGQFQGIPLTHQLTLTANITSSLPPPQFQGVLYYKLLYAGAHPGNVATLVNQFTDNTNVPVRIESIDIKLDFAEYTWQATGNTLPLVLQQSQSSTMNMSEMIPATTVPGIHQVSVTFTFQVDTGSGWSAEGSTTTQGSMIISPNPAAQIIVPTLLSMVGSIFRSPLFLFVIAAYFVSTAGLAVYIARWDERHRRASMPAR